ncbi:MAG: hypothetical protein U0T36_10425 [Saprospiraceae bacterium]
MTEEEVQQNFLILAEADFLPFMMEIGIYNGNGEDCVACAVTLEDGTDVIQFSEKSGKDMAKSFQGHLEKIQESQYLDKILLHLHLKL